MHRKRIGWYLVLGVAGAFVFPVMAHADDRDGGAVDGGRLQARFESAYRQKNPGGNPKFQVKSVRVSRSNIVTGAQTTSRPISSEAWCGSWINNLSGPVVKTFKAKIEYSDSQAYEFRSDAIMAASQYGAVDLTVKAISAEGGMGQTRTVSLNSGNASTTSNLREYTDETPVTIEPRSQVRVTAKMKIFQTSYDLQGDVVLDGSVTVTRAKTTEKACISFTLKCSETSYQSRTWKYSELLSESERTFPVNGRLSVTNGHRGNFDWRADPVPLDQDASCPNE